MHVKGAGRTTTTTYIEMESAYIFDSIFQKFEFGELPDLGGSKPRAPTSSKRRHRRGKYDEYVSHYKRITMVASGTFLFWVILVHTY